MNKKLKCGTYVRPNKYAPFVESLLGRVVHVWSNGVVLVDFGGETKRLLLMRDELSIV